MNTIDKDLLEIIEELNLNKEEAEWFIKVMTNSYNNQKL